MIVVPMDAITAMAIVDADETSALVEPLRTSMRRNVVVIVTPAAKTSQRCQPANTDWKRLTSTSPQITTAVRTMP